MGWGSHEKNFPRDGKRHDFGCMAAIYLMQPGVGITKNAQKRHLETIYLQIE